MTFHYWNKDCSSQCMTTTSDITLRIYMYLVLGLNGAQMNYCITPWSGEILYLEKYYSN